MPEAEFTALLRQGVSFSQAPGLAMEYSNLGYALLGRVIGNVTGQPYAQAIDERLLRPLGMADSGFVVGDAPIERRALGYRWQGDAWHREPDLAHGAFGAMGGLQTSAQDYARWVAALLSAWPARDEADRGPVRRATVREIVQGSNFPRYRTRPGSTGATACQQAATYGMAMTVAIDCELGLTLNHGGGYPGYGSHVLLLPDQGIGIFGFSNLTYGSVSAPVWDSAMLLARGGYLQPRKVPVSAELAAAYAAVGGIYARGEVESTAELLAMNFLLDRDAQQWRQQLAKIKAEVGACETGSPARPSGALQADFEWRCERGHVAGNLLLSPTLPPRIQALTLAPATD